MKSLAYVILWFLALPAMAQDDVYPAKKQEGVLVIRNGIIHTGTGQVIPQGVIVIKDGKIQSVGAPAATIPGATVVDAAGKHIYPGLILASTDLGLREIMSGVRGSNDFYELGDYNPDVRSIVAYNTDSRIINTLRSNGILLANIVPSGSLLTGSSSVVQLDAWTWEDALYKADNGMFLNLPMLLKSPRSGASDPVKEGIKRIEALKAFLQEAKAYAGSTAQKEVNLKFEALRPLFAKKQKLFVNANISRQILMAIDIAKTFDIRVVIVGGSDSYLLANLLRQNNIPVILNAIHALPTLEDDDVDQPFKTPALLQKAGVLFALNDDESSSRYRNLSFFAGTAAAYGLSKEEALQAITLNAARILGIDDRTGSLEAGKDANIVIAAGDLLDMKESAVTEAYIQGRKIDLNNKHKQLYDRYRHRYQLQ
ncbi:amidohydrolase family protein [Niabella drilacis]|uniref:Imidazolonepropionase n=1 Tax=Niabella drilacis (strain DSM 25811 / CCM 8410 / CCUG 62505 / LMG 26954 / E90) TaxID=1285928 RepID=A0A1G6I156_NIADE|nr:amidohydrolase family protein [Niabella drilacis]SDC00287.1 Imidazolonepropionase [Niabella drilacis]